MRLLGKKSNLRLLFRRPGAILCRYWPVIALLVVGATADAVTTYNFLVKYGPSEEVHPVQQIIFQILPPLPGVIFAKLAQSVFVVLVACCFRGWTTWLILLTGLLYAAGAACNHYGWMVYVYEVCPWLL